MDCSPYAVSAQVMLIINLVVRCLTFYKVSSTEV